MLRLKAEGNCPQIVEAMGISLASVFRLLKEEAHLMCLGCATAVIV